MPLFKRKPFKRNPIPEGVKDDDEVFYCEQTKEVFKTYDEFFERVMLTNSVIWQCSLTGRPDLTYVEALESEKTAKKLLRQFPSALRGPVLYVASLTKRSALKELVDDVFNFTKDHFFKDEKIDVMNASGKGCRFCKIVQIIVPEDYNEQTVYEPLKIEYRVEAIDDDKQPQSWIVKGESLRRDKTVFAREKTKLFLKQHVEAANLLLKVKQESIKKYVTDRGLKVEEMFIGKLPDFEVSKKLQQQKEKQQEKATKPKKAPATKEVKEKSDKPKKKSSGKNGDITKYLNNSGTKELSPEAKKKREADAKKFREELEAKKKRKADLEAEKKKKAEEERARILSKTHAAIKDLNQVRDDLELIDQRVLPKGQPVSTLLEMKYFGDIIRILEFFHSFPEVVGSREKFPFGFTMEIIERALLGKEINGPLSDIFQALLGAIFSLQTEEDEESKIEYRISSGDINLHHPLVEKLQNASKLQIWAEKYMSTKIHDMSIDSTTLTEVLRLHLLGSGAAVSETCSKYRVGTRGGYKSRDDPGLDFVLNHPHIISFLTQKTVFELSTKDIIRLIHCLIDQILSYSNVRDIIDERLEQSSNARLEYKNLKVLESRRERKVAEEKKALQEEHKTIIAGFAEEQPAVIEALIKNAEAELEKKIAKIDASSAKEHSIHLQELRKQVSVFFNHQVYLGCDRAFRSYYIYESFPCVFVEHDITYSGSCLDKFTKNNAALASCTKEQKYQIIKQMVKDEESASNDDKENKADVNGTEKAPTVTGIVKKENDLELQRELFMCNCDPSTCAVHSNSPDRVVWTFFSTAEEIDALIDSLNSKGYREKNLLETLESCRDQIVDYIKNCQTTKITVNSSEVDKAELLRRVKTVSKRYDNPYFGLDQKLGMTNILETVLRTNILEFENKVTMGCLGKLKVQDRELWRKYIYDGEYFAMDDNLKWGKDLEQNGAENGHVINGHGNEEDEENEEESETASSVDDLDPLNTIDSGNCSEVSETSGEKTEMKTAEMENVKVKVKNLAMALLQIEQSIDVKFIRAPFKPSKEPKDKALLTKFMQKCKVKLLRWEQSLMKSTSYSQVFLHLNILYDSILWTRSAKNAGCMVCRKKDDPEQTLLCDECNRGWHMYCLKPKITDIPTGDWFCPKCRPEDYKRKSTRKRRQVFVEEEEEEEEEEELTADETMDSQEDGSYCHVCQNEGEKMIACSTCDFECHPTCAKPPVKRNVKNWKCSKCIQSEERSQRLKRRRVDKDDDDESEVESEEERPAKIKKVEKRKSSKRVYDSEESVESDFEVPSKRSADDRRSTGRRSNRQSRKNTPEYEESNKRESTRRSSKKFAVEESSVERRASKRSLELLNTISLGGLVDEIIKNKNSWPFTKAVSPSEVPDYYDVIKNPMDFGKIRSKLNLMEYKTNEQVLKDFEQVFVNCDLYNVANSEIYSAGVKLEKLVIKRCKELNFPYKPSDMSS